MEYTKFCDDCMTPFITYNQVVNTCDVCLNKEDEVNILKNNITEALE